MSQCALVATDMSTSHDASRRTSAESAALSTTGSIRMVPYSPPRSTAGGRTASASSTTQARPAGPQKRASTSSEASAQLRRWREWSAANANRAQKAQNNEPSTTKQQGFALSSASPSTLRLAALRERGGVSARGSFGDAPKSSATTTPAARPSSHVDAVHASTTSNSNSNSNGNSNSSSNNTTTQPIDDHDNSVSTIPSTARHSLSSSRQSLVSSQFSASSDQEPQSSAPTTPTLSTHRSTPRRRNLIALNPDKTFSLLPAKKDIAGGGDHRDPSSDHGGSGSADSPSFVSSSTLSPRVSSAHEDTSYRTSNSGGGDLAVSPVTSIGSTSGDYSPESQLHDRAPSPLSPTPQPQPSRGYIPKLSVPDHESIKTTRRASASPITRNDLPSQTSLALTPSPEAGVAAKGGDPFNDSRRLVEQASFDSNSTTDSRFETTNYDIHALDSSPPVHQAEPTSQATPSPRRSPAQATEDLSEILTDLHKDTSSAFRTSRSLPATQIEVTRPVTPTQSSPSASTASENTNYKTYENSSPTRLPFSSPIVTPPTQANRYSLKEKDSLESTQSGSTDFASNYRVYTNSSPAQESVENFRPYSHHSNAPLLVTRSEISLVPSDYADEEPNYTVYEEPAPSYAREPRPTYSQESLIVPPLEPRKNVSAERLDYYRSRSKRSPDGLAESTKSGKTAQSHNQSSKSVHSIGSFISEGVAEPLPVFAGQALLKFHKPSKDKLAGPSSTSSSSQPKTPTTPPTTITISSQQQPQAQTSPLWAANRTDPASSTSGNSQDTTSLSTTQTPAPPMFPVSPHQWSSQLSTIMSDDEGGSSAGDGAPSTRRVSSASGFSQPGSIGRMSSVGSRGYNSSSSGRPNWEPISTDLPSIAAEMSSSERSNSLSNPRSQTTSSGDSPYERPLPTIPRNIYRPMVRDHDEDGDGLGDLQQIQPRPSRSGLSMMYSSSTPSSSERNLRSSASNQSFNSTTIPTWARLYYSSAGPELRRMLSFSSTSSAVPSSGGISRPGTGRTMDRERSPSADRFAPVINNPRRRAREQQRSLRGTGTGMSGKSRRTTQQHQRYGSSDIGPIPEHEIYHDIGDENNYHDIEQGSNNGGSGGGAAAAGGGGDSFSIRRGVRRMTSSVWSPHLQTDRRANRYETYWKAPSVTWSMDNGPFGRRNVQVLGFVVGFVLPLVWIIAAFLPLPADSPLSMLEKGAARRDGISRPQETISERKYQSAKWWRSLNRFMAVVAVLVIGVVIGLGIATARAGAGLKSSS